MMCWRSKAAARSHSSSYFHQTPAKYGSEARQSSKICSNGILCITTRNSGPHLPRALGFHLVRATYFGHPRFYFVQLALRCSRSRQELWITAMAPCEQSYIPRRPMPVLPTCEVVFGSLHQVQAQPSCTGKCACGSVGSDQYRSI
jgi:hypothetical protein